MTAIWPAGPPNVCSEMANHARTAVRNGMASRTGRASLVMSTSPASGRLATQQGPPAVVLVEPVEELTGYGEGALVVPRHREPAEEDVQPRRLRRVEAVVVEVGDVHDLGDPPQHRIGELVAAQDGLEAAVPTDMTELHAAQDRKSVV